MDVLTPLYRGAYDGHRTAALAGVPYSTLQCWARKGIVVPTISPDRVRLWSWADLLRIRAVTWLRQPRHVPMPRVRSFLKETEDVPLSSMFLRRLVLVSEARDVYIRLEEVTYRADPRRQIVMEGMLDLTAPFDRGPDLLVPRPHLRIVPGKLSG